MATLRSRRYLCCFYCGRRSKLQFEGQKSFVCTSCDATNWLDQNGDITDPPSTTSPIECTRVQYAVARSSATRSPSPLVSPNGVDSGEPVFCDTCLRNQHMLTSSLAQFEWPDDQYSAEYAVRERKYWALRRDLEKRYPQMCAKCKPMVEKKLHEASYTAKTDHLRRMMDRTRTQRQEVKRRGVLDVVDAAGRWSWHLGFALQFSWHVAILYSLIMGQYIGASEAKSWIAVIIQKVHKLGCEWLSKADGLMYWAITLSLFSFPWNPRFKQTVRGFTAHILGFKQWYTFQLLILLIRCVSLSMAQYSSSKGLPSTTQLGAQFAVVLLMAYVYHASRKSIHIDMTPLFPKSSKTASLQGSPVRLDSPRDPNDLGNILDEISNSPSESHSKSAFSPPRGSNAYRPTVATNRLSDGLYGRRRENNSTESALNSLRLSDPVVVEKPQLQRQPRIVHYEEEMDWTPSASQHRAFSSYNPYKVKNTNPRFNDTPIEPKAGPIWYKVPPAPTSPAQRLRNPPMRPIIRESPKEKKENFFQSATRGPVDMGSSSQGSLSDIKFAEPIFFAPQEKDDPRDSLSNMFANSFSISPSPDDEIVRRSKSTTKRPFFRTSHSTAEAQDHHAARIAEVFVLAGALYGWVLGLGTEEQYGSTLALASIIACLIVSIRLAADLQANVQMRGGQLSIFALSWANLALAQVVSTLILSWVIWSGGGMSSPWRTYGNTHFATVIVHHIWHVFV
ncbi:hypothetical protein AAE478_005828 [Parahypoxylon ruwenzoriense]